MSRPVIGVITYQRPDGLRRLLASLVSELDLSRDRVIVVDNDRLRSAEAVCRSFGQILNVMYEVEPRRGVSHPRNKVIALANDAESIIFLDDDEWVDEGWFEEILQSSRRYPEALVTGPVRYVLPGSKQLWADRAGYFQTYVHPHDSVVENTGAGNTLIPRSALRRLTLPQFDSTYSISGGEDQELFGRLKEKGCEIRWSAGAGVREEVPPSRATQKWVHRRFARSGYIRGRVMLQNKRSSALVGMHGLLRLCAGGGSYLLTFAGLSNDARNRARALATAFSGLGFLSAAARRPIEAYGIGDGEER